MTIALDPSVFVGQYPFRHLPHPDADVLVKVLAREGIARAWVGYLPAAWHRDPGPANAELQRLLAPHRDVLVPAPTVRPDFPLWEQELDDAKHSGAEAIRVYPAQWRLAPGDDRLTALALACAARGLAIVATVRFEDLRQRHPMDTAGDLAGATLRQIARAGEGVRLVVSAAGKELVEEVHWGLTPAEQRRVWWDISWIWGPPEDQLAGLFRTIGAERFVFGSQWPLRLVQAPKANLELLPPDLQGTQLGSPR